MSKATANRALRVLGDRNPEPTQTALPVTLDDLFSELAKYGRLRSFGQLSNGNWEATLGVPTTNPGITATLHEWSFTRRHATPHVALSSFLAQYVWGQGTTEGG